jgi:hypothetical protein
VYHVELRQFPHNFCRFNLTELELRATVLDRWACGEWIEIGERKWSPHQATLTVLEGPQLPVERLSLGRGWRNAVRQGKDVTAQLLADAQSAEGSARRQFKAEDQGPHEAADGLGIDMRLIADSLGLETLAKLEDEPVPLVEVWQLARERYPAYSASDCLKLAEHAILSLSARGLVVVLAANDGGERGPCAPGEPVEQVMRAIESWSSSDGSTSGLIRKA